MVLPSRAFYQAVEDAMGAANAPILYLHPDDKSSARYVIIECGPKGHLAKLMKAEADIGATAEVARATEDPAHDKDFQEALKNAENLWMHHSHIEVGEDEDENGNSQEEQAFEDSQGESEDARS